MLVDRDTLFAKLEADGEANVREKLAGKRYGEWKVPLVQEWLRQQEEMRRGATANANIAIGSVTRHATGATASASANAAIDVLRVLPRTRRRDALIEAQTHIG